VTTAERPPGASSAARGAPAAQSRDFPMFIDGAPAESASGKWIEVKQSGFGKDMSTYSFEEYTQVKHVMLELTGQPEKGWHYTIFGDKPGE
jgi:hypothetical protein